MIGVDGLRKTLERGRLSNRKINGRIKRDIVRRVEELESRWEGGMKLTGSWLL